MKSEGKVRFYLVDGCSASTIRKEYLRELNKGYKDDFWSASNLEMGPLTLCRAKAYFLDPKRAMPLLNKKVT